MMISLKVSLCGEHLASLQCLIDILPVNACFEVCFTAAATLLDSLDSSVGRYTSECR